MFWSLPPSGADAVPGHPGSLWRSDGEAPAMSEATDNSAIYVRGKPTSKTFVTAAAEAEYLSIVVY
jgi:hypothetical protein